MEIQGFKDWLRGRCHRLFDIVYQVLRASAAGFCSRFERLDFHAERLAFFADQSAEMYLRIRIVNLTAQHSITNREYQLLASFARLLARPSSCQ